MVVVMALRQRRPSGWSARQIMDRFGICLKTLLRWMAYFKDVFPSSAQWQRLRGRISSDVANRELPGALLDYFLQHHKPMEEGLINCLHFLAKGSATFG
jgi:hypothetical protein